MNVILFDAAGMVGQRVTTRGCLLERDVQFVLSIGRRATGQSHPKLRKIVHSNLVDLAPLESPRSSFDACFFWLSEADYRAFPQFGTTTERLGRAMPFVARHGAPKPILEARDVNALQVDDHR